MYVSSRCNPKTSATLSYIKRCNRMQQQLSVDGRSQGRHDLVSARGKKTRPRDGPVFAWGVYPTLLISFNLRSLNVLNKPTFCDSIIESIDYFRLNSRRQANICWLWYPKLVPCVFEYLLSSVQITVPPGADPRDHDSRLILPIKRTLRKWSQKWRSFPVFYSNEPRTNCVIKMFAVTIDFSNHFIYFFIWGTFELVLFSFSEISIDVV